jgi:chromosome segregation ATPase
MSGMRRADRRDANYDNIINNPQSRQVEPSPPRELNQALMTARSQRDEAKAEIKTLKDQREVESKEFQNTLFLYNEEKSKSAELLLKYIDANAQQAKYLDLYTESQVKLKEARKTIAGLRGWSTRRKKENDNLKQKISGMVVQLRDSYIREDEAIQNLYGLAERMDKIQKILDPVNEEYVSVEQLTRISILLKVILDE